MRVVGVLICFFFFLLYRGHNLWKGTCNFSLWISREVKLLKHMLHHLLNLKYEFFLFFQFMYFWCIIWLLFHFIFFIYLFILFDQLPGNENPSTLISFATKTLNAGQITSKLHVIELGAQPGKVALIMFCCFLGLVYCVVLWIAGSKLTFDLKILGLAIIL